MSKPCSQLKSKAIRDKAECEIVARVEKLCSVVAFKCVCRVNDAEKERAWNWICEKRDECDLTLSKLAEFFFFGDKYVNIGQQEGRKATIVGDQRE